MPPRKKVVSAKKHPKTQAKTVKPKTSKISKPKPKPKPKREYIPLTLRIAVLARDGFRCVYCGATGKRARLEIDHKIPVSKGGTNSMKNLQSLCFKCNRGKSAKIIRIKKV